VTALIGGLGLALAIHGAIGRLRDTGSNSRDFAALREAQLILAEQLRELHHRIGDLSETVREESIRRSDELTSEVRMLEDLVQRMTDGLQDSLSSRTQFAPSHVHNHQHVALLETVREALAENRVDLYLQPVVSLPSGARSSTKASRACATPPAG